MSIDITPSQVRDRLNAQNEIIEQILERITMLLSDIDAYNNENALQGRAFRAHKKYKDQAHGDFSRRLRSAYTSFQGANEHHIQVLNSFTRPDSRHCSVQIDSEITYLNNRINNIDWWRNTFGWMENVGTIIDHFTWETREILVGRRQIQEKKQTELQTYERSTMGIYNEPTQFITEAESLLMRIEFAGRCATTGVVTLLPMEHIENLNSLLSQLASARTPEARNRIISSITELIMSLPIDVLLKGKSAVYRFAFVMPTGHLVTGYFNVNAKLQSNTPGAIAALEADIVNQLNSITFNAQQVGMFVAAEKDGFNFGAEVDGVEVAWDLSKIAAGIISVTFSLPGPKIDDFSTGSSATFNIHLNRYPPRADILVGADPYMPYSGIWARPDYSKYVYRSPFPGVIPIEEHTISPPIGAPIPDVTTPPLTTPPAAGEAIPPNNIPIPVPIPIPMPPPPLPVPVPKPIPIPVPIF